MPKNIWNTIKLPVLLLGIVLTLSLFWKILDLPPEDQLIEIARKYFDKYGLIVLLISAIIEGVLLVGWYYPGSLVIFLGVIFAGKNVSLAIETVLIITLGLYLAYLINYILGKYGWYRLLLAFGLSKPLEKAQLRITKYGFSGILLSYWHPNLAAIASTAAGTLQFSWRKFLIYSLISVSIWNIFWGTLVYFLGEASLGIVGLKFVLIAIVGWIIVNLIKQKATKDRNNISLP
jgi:membrane protein DedA with SNARE-associated domain